MVIGYFISPNSTGKDKNLKHGSARLPYCPVKKVLTAECNSPKNKQTSYLKKSCLGCLSPHSFGFPTMLSLQVDQSPPAKVQK
jgi:hypothetical protein